MAVHTKIIGEIKKKKLIILFCYFLYQELLQFLSIIIYFIVSGESGYYINISYNKPEKWIMIAKSLPIVKRILPNWIKPIVRNIYYFFEISPSASKFQNRKKLAKKYIRGEGIEIGALHSPLQAPGSAKVKYVDRMSVDELRKHYPELSQLELVKIDIIDDGEELRNIQDFSQDFVIANHFLEHCSNPILALKNLSRVIKPGGILYLAIPDKRFTFDNERKITPLNHLIQDYENGPEWSKREHFEEWVRKVMKISGEEEVRKQLQKLIEMDYSIHYHVWTQVEILELMITLKRQMGLNIDIELFMQNSDECILILRKAGM